MMIKKKINNNDDDDDDPGGLQYERHGDRGFLSEN